MYKLNGLPKNLEVSHAGVVVSVSPFIEHLKCALLPLYVFFITRGIKSKSSNGFCPSTFISSFDTFD